METKLWSCRSRKEGPLHQEVTIGFRKNTFQIYCLTWIYLRQPCMTFLYMEKKKKKKEKINNIN